MTCINTGNAWVRVRNGARQGPPDALPDWLSLHFSLLSVYLGGEISSLKLGLGLCSFSRRWLLHASIDNRIDLLRNFEFDRTGGWSEREVWPIDRHPIVRSLLTMVDLLDPLFQSWLCLDNTNQRCCWRGTWSPLSFWRGHVHCASARIDVCCRGKHSLKLQLQLQWTVSWRQRVLSEVLQGLTTPTEVGPIFQIVVDDIEVEMWSGWLENHEMGSALLQFHCGGRRTVHAAWEQLSLTLPGESLTWRAVLCWRVAGQRLPGDFISTCLQRWSWRHTLENRACRHGTVHG